MSDFLDTLSFLTPEQREVLRSKDLDTPEAFKHVTLERLEGEPFKFTTGRASKLLTAAGAGATTAPSTVTVNFEPPDVQARIDRALDAAAANPSKLGALADLGVEVVVLDSAGKVDPAKTRAMRVHAASGAPVGPTWQGQRIAKTRELASPVIYRCPSTGAPLQDGRAEDTGIAWADLGLGGLRIAAFGYQHNMFRGLTDEAVFEGLKPGAALHQRVATRMAALGTKPEDMDPDIMVRPREVTLALPTRQPPLRMGSSPVTNLSNLFVVLFNEGELRRLIGYLPNGTSLVNNLPGGVVSMATLAYEAADVLHRHGAFNRVLRERLLVERPRKADDIDAVFAAAGII